MPCGHIFHKSFSTLASTQNLYPDFWPWCPTTRKAMDRTFYNRGWPLDRGSPEINIRRERNAILFDVVLVVYL